MPKWKLQLQAQLMSQSSPLFHVKPLAPCRMDRSASTKSAPPYVKMPSFSVELPPEVPDTDTWGRTIIEFGQFGKDELTYAQLHARNDEKAVSYKKWCRSRHMTAHGQLADFAKFLIHMDSLSKSPAVTQGPFIPGTSMMRRYK